MAVLDIEKRIEDHLNNFDLDLRASHNARFMDQKITPDVLSFMADCILNYVRGDINAEFSVGDIWDSSYFDNTIKLIFNKPDVQKETVVHEYDKFIGQPIKTLEYARILIPTSRKGPFRYRVQNLELLEYIALKEKYALNFLYIYLRKVLKDSDFIKYIDQFISDCKLGTMNNAKFQELKSRYHRFIIGNTPINTTVEVSRIFSKVLNVFSAMHYIPGTIKGRLSDHPIYYHDLMYNRINFRDVEKDKSISRQEAATQIIPDETRAYNEYMIQKAMNIIKYKYQLSEVKDDLATGPANYVHHIFSRTEFAELAHFLENLIKLTAEQHFTRAHPNANTHIINSDYQLICLLAKSESIEKSLAKGEFLYSKPSFIYVINTGLKISDKSPFNLSLSFNQIRGQLQVIYKST